MPFEKLKCISDLSNKSCCDLYCSIDSQARQTRLPFHDSHYESASLFDLVLGDIWGPYRVPSVSGVIYFLTVVEDKSRCTWMFLLDHKISDVTQMVHVF